MNAVILHEFGGPDELKYEQVADPVPGDGEVLIRVVATSVNPVDYKLRRGDMKDLMPLDLPAIPGRDIAGVVRETGRKVHGFAPGDRVLALGNRAYAELAVVKASDVARLPEKLDLVEAAALPLVTLTGAQLVMQAAKIVKGQTVLVAGAVGGVGRSAVWAAKKAGARVIAGVRKAQVEQAKALRADEVIALDDESAMERLGFVDAVADTVGGETAEKLLGKVKQGGIFASVLGEPKNAGLHPTIQIAAMMVKPDAVLLEALAGDAAAGDLVIPIDRMVSLADAGKAQAAAEKGGIGKVLLLA